MTHLLGRAAHYAFLIRSRWCDARSNPVEGNPGCGCSKRREEAQGNRVIAYWPWRRREGSSRRGDDRSGSRQSGRDPSPRHRLVRQPQEPVRPGYVADLVVRATSPRSIGVFLGTGRLARGVGPGHGLRRCQRAPETHHRRGRVICDSDEIADLLDELRGAWAQIRRIRKAFVTTRIWLQPRVMEADGG